jgi:hypothetical protein
MAAPISNKLTMDGTEDRDRGALGGRPEETEEEWEMRGGGRS